MNDLQMLFIRGMQTIKPEAKPEDILHALVDGMTSGRLKVFVKGTHAFVILAIPETPYDVLQIMHFYAERPGDKKALMDKVLAFAKEKGYTRFWALNATDKPDKVWERTFRSEAWDISPIRTLFEFKVK